MVFGNCGYGYRFKTIHEYFYTFCYHYSMKNVPIVYQTQLPTETIDLNKVKNFTLHGVNYNLHHKI